MYKKLLVLFGMVAISVTLAGCSGDANTEKPKIYKATSIKVSYSGDDDWLVKGKTKAPDGSKILIVPSESISNRYKENASSSTSYGNFAKVKNGKFEAIADGIWISGTGKLSAGDTYKVQIMAVKNYKKSFDSDYDEKIPQKIFKEFKDNFKAATLKLSSHQAKDINSIGSSSSSSSSSVGFSSSSSESSSSTETSSVSKSPSANTIYGKLTDPYADDQQGLGMTYTDDHSWKTIKFGVNDDNEISSIFINYRKLPIDPDDEESQIKKYTADDVTEVSRDDDGNPVYESDSLQLTYVIEDTTNSDGLIKTLKIMPGDVNGISYPVK